MKLSDIIDKQRQQEKDAFENTPEKDVNYYHIAKKERVAKGIDDELVFEGEDEEL